MQTMHGHSKHSNMEQAHELIESMYELASTLTCQTRATIQPTKGNFGQKFTKSCAYAHYAPLDPMVT